MQGYLGSRSQLEKGDLGPVVIAGGDKSEVVVDLVLWEPTEVDLVVVVVVVVTRNIVFPDLSQILICQSLRHYVAKKTNQPFLS